MGAERLSPGKINLLLNVLRRREDGFHELETLMHPVGVCDELSVERGGEGIRLSCNRADLPTDSSNLVHRAAAAFLERSGITEGVSIHLEKRLPLAAGLGGGSSNAASTLLLLNEVYDELFEPEALSGLASTLGSDVPFFLQAGPALASGRGERIEAVGDFECLQGVWVFLVHPGFGVSTPWAYRQLQAYPAALNGAERRARKLVEWLRAGELATAGEGLYNALEGPVHTKYPLLKMFQEFLRSLSPIGVLMSGSGSTTFSLWDSEAAARVAEERFRGEFGENSWRAIVSLTNRR